MKTPDLPPKWSEPLTTGPGHWDPPDLSAVPATGPTLVVFQGLPGSGKTTAAYKLLAEYPDTRRRVNRDAIRWMLFNSPFIPRYPEREHEVTVVQVAAIRHLLLNGYVVLADDTNLWRPGLDRLRQLVAAHASAEDMIIVDFLGVPLAECIRRDAARPEAERVGESVIRDMLMRWHASAPKEM